MMTVEELAIGLNNLYPTRFSHFSSKQDPPFICYLDVDYQPVEGDNEVIAERVGIDIEFYSLEKDFAAERKIKDFLNTNKLPYGQSPTIFIESEGLFQCVFSITLINKI